MAIADITKPIALDETLQSTNTALGGVAKDTTLQSTNGKMDSVITKLQGIIDALGIKTSVYKAGGDKTCAELVPALLIEDYCGYVYNITDTGTTTSDFVEGAGKPINIGDNVGIVDRGTGGNHVYKFDLMAGMVDLTDYIKKSSTSGFVKNDGTIDTTTYQPTEAGKGLSSNDYTTADKNKLAGISTNAKKVESSTTNGNIKIDNVETQVYDDTEIKTELSTDTTEVEGNPISFSTLTAQNALECSIELDPIQDLHGFDRPWVGGAGKNLLNDQDKYLNGNEIKFGYEGQESGSNYTLVLDAGTYTFSFTAIDGNFTNLYIINAEDLNEKFASGGITNNYTFTIPSRKKIAVHLYKSTYTSADVIVTAQIESGSTATSHEPYENICPISGRTEANLYGCGINVWDEEWEVGSYDITTGAKSTDNTRIRNKNKIPIKSNTAYCFSTQTSRIPTILWYDKYENFISITSNSASSAFVTTSPTNARYACFFGTTTYGTTYNNDICVNISDSSFDGQYTPYTESNNLTISFGETVYGGTLDVEKGELVVDRGYLADLSQLTWGKRNTVTNKWEFYTALASMKLPQSSDYYADMNCSIYKIITANQAYNGNNGIGISCGTNAGNATLFVYDDTISELTDFQNAMSEVQLTYELATPTVIQLTPHQISLLKGVNNISVSDDYSEITLTYRSGEVATLGDLKEQIEEVRSEIPTGTGSNYSTTEHTVGTWIDGSTIYEITYETNYTQSSGSWTSTGIAKSNSINKIIRNELIDSYGQNYVGAVGWDSGYFATFLPINATIKFMTICYTKST